jgi:hypothetical protein
MCLSWSMAPGPAETVALQVRQVWVVQVFRASTLKMAHA